MLQSENQISDAGAAGLGEGLKVNSSLQGLYLVRLFDYCLFFVGMIQGEGGEGVGWSDACAVERKSNFRRWSCRAGRGAESQQQSVGALSCKAF